LSSLMSRSRWMTPAVSSISSRSLITNQNPESIVPYSDYTDWVQRLVESKARDRSQLAELVPKKEDELPQRTMRDSLLQARIPIGSDPEVRLQYSSCIVGGRVGKLVKDMDLFAAIILYKHILNPHIPDADQDNYTAHKCMTLRMDHLHIRERIRNDRDILLVGHVTYVGRSSAEVGIRMEQMVDDGETGNRTHVCEARFVMASRDAATGTKAARLNPLNLTTPEEKYLFALGEKSITLRAKKHGDTLFENPPSGDENQIIHKMFLSTIDHRARSFSARKKPDNSEWMTDSKLKSVLLCEPKHRNYYNLVFGGLIMEKCMDLALTNTYNYTGCEAAPKCTHVDDVLFLKPVEIGDLLFFHSQVVFTHENKVQTRVSAEVKSKDDKNLKLTNVLQITWELPERVREVVPKSYHEAMAYLTGRRHFMMSLENEGLLDKGMAEIQCKHASNYLPNWVDKENPRDHDDSFKEDEEMKYFLKGEETNQLRENEYGAM